MVLQNKLYDNPSIDVKTIPAHDLPNDALFDKFFNNVFVKIPAYLCLQDKKLNYSLENLHCEISNRATALELYNLKQYLKNKMGTNRWS